MSILHTHYINSGSFVLPPQGLKGAPIPGPRKSLEWGEISREGFGPGLSLSRHPNKRLKALRSKVTGAPFPRALLVYTSCPRLISNYTWFTASVCSLRKASPWGTAPIRTDGNTLPGLLSIHLSNYMSIHLYGIVPFYIPIASGDSQKDQLEKCPPLRSWKKLLAASDRGVWFPPGSREHASQASG